MVRVTFGVFRQWEFDELIFYSINDWVLAQNLLLSSLNSANVAHIGAYIGTFLSVDLGLKSLIVPPNTLRIKVQLVISHKLVTCFFLEREGKTTSVELI